MKHNYILHADNCVGQNKNNFMLQVCIFPSKIFFHCIYFSVLCLVGSISTLSFMIVGHTKFSRRPTEAEAMPPRCEYNCLNNTARKVENLADVNSAQLISREQLIPTYDWAFDHFKTSTVKKSSDHESLYFHILRTNWTPSFTKLPQIIIPAGQSSVQQHLPRRALFFFTYILAYHHIQEHLHH